MHASACQHACMHLPCAPRHLCSGCRLLPPLRLCASAFVLKLVPCSLCVQVKPRGQARLQAPSLAPWPACAARYPRGAIYLQRHVDGKLKSPGLCSTRCALSAQVRTRGQARLPARSARAPAKSTLCPCSFRSMQVLRPAPAAWTVPAAARCTPCAHWTTPAYSPTPTAQYC